MRILQLNMHRGRVADSLLSQIILEQESDVAIICEQYMARKTGYWLSDETSTAAIWIPDCQGPRPVGTGGGDCYTWAQFEDITLMSCYLTPSDAIATFEEKLGRIEDAIMDIGGNFIVAGDFNSRAVEWGMQNTNSRGRRIVEMAARTGLTFANVGNVSTFRRPGCDGTIPDITMVSEGISNKVVEWKVLEIYTGSDHQYISYIFNSRNGEVAQRRMRSNRRWDTRRLNKNSLISEIDRLCLNTEFSDDARSRTSQTMRIIRRGCETAMPLLRTSNSRRKAVYWWDDHIATLRRECLRLRRKFTRARCKGPALEEARAFKEARRSLKEAIMRKKAQAFQELRDDINFNPYGLGYKIVMDKLGARKSVGVMSEHIMGHIVETLFPTHELVDERGHYENAMEFIPSTERELSAAASGLRPGKAPGPDGIPSEVMREIAAQRPEILLAMYNACLRESIFPKIWKRQSLLLISKGKGDSEHPSSYRPLCMLDTAGKLLERLIKPRLATAIAEGGGLSARQHGFRSGRSTIGALREVINAATGTRQGNHFSRPIVLLATLDVKNAFNSLRWNSVLNALENDFSVPHNLLMMISSYLSDRQLIYNTSSGPRKRQITSGAAQGSILGPELWNASYDGILREDMPVGTFLVGYADDIAAVITARNTEEARRKLKQVMIRTRMWLEVHGLELATHKTELLLITRRHIPLQVEMDIGGEIIRTKSIVKYLGLRLDPRLTFVDQIKYAANKAQNIVKQLSRLMANIGGPLPAKRRLLMEAANNIMLYGSEIWADTLKVKRRARLVGSVQRIAALRITSSYRTVSAAAVLVIAGVIPLDLLAEERMKIYMARSADNPEISHIRQETLLKWQQCWDDENRGRWTARLIPSIATWIGRGHGEVNYYTTQMLSGHGYFRKYLYKMGKCDSPYCLYEGEDVIDDAEHTIFDCTRWDPYRSELISVVGSITVENIVLVMVASVENWNWVTRYVEWVLKRKKKDLEATESAAPGRRLT